MLVFKGRDFPTQEQLYELASTCKCIIYARVSSAGQVDQYSLETQIERCKEHAISKFAYVEDEIIVFVEEGISGGTENRPALNNMLELMEKGIGRRVILLHPDRLARDSGIASSISNRIWNMGCDIDFVEMHLDQTNPESVMLFQFQNSIAQYNKAKILANSKRGRIAMAKKNLIPSFRRLYGYNYDNGELTINEQERDVILLMVDLLLNKDMSLNSIAKHLSKLGIPSPLGEIWYQHTVGRLLKTESLTGKFIYGKSKTVADKNGKRKQVPNEDKSTWITIQIPQILDDLTFQKIAEKIEKNNRTRGRKSKKYLLKDIAVCGRCGSAAGSGTTSTTKTGKYLYYSCRKKQSKKYKNGEKIDTCYGKVFRVDHVDKVVWDWLSDMITNPEKIIQSLVDSLSDKEKFENLKKKAEDYTNKIDELKQEQKNYVILFGKGRIDEETLDSLIDPIEEKLDFLENELKVTNSEIMAYSNDEEEVEKVQEYLKIYQDKIKSPDLDMDTKMDIAKIFIRKVTIMDDGLLIVQTRWGDTHKNYNYKQGQRFNFYVTFTLNLSDFNTENTRVYHYEQYSHMLDKLVKMNHEELLTAYEISKETNISVDDIQKLFEVNDIELLKLKEIAKRRRTKDFDFLYNEHFNNKLSLNEIQRRYGFSPPYVKRVFSDKNITHIGFVNQNK